MHPFFLPPLFFLCKLCAAVELLSSPILLAAGSHPPPVLLPNQGYPKVHHDPLNLPSTFTLAAGDPLRRNATVLLPVLCFPSDKGLHCFDSKSSRVHSAK
jgi:hypothetical protein